VYTCQFSHNKQNYFRSVTTQFVGMRSHLKLVSLRKSQAISVLWWMIRYFGLLRPVDKRILWNEPVIAMGRPWQRRFVISVFTTDCLNWTYSYIRITLLVTRMLIAGVSYVNRQTSSWCFRTQTSCFLLETVKFSSYLIDRPWPHNLNVVCNAKKCIQNTSPLSHHTKSFVVD
jgi:hypothetical protein